LISLAIPTVFARDQGDSRIESLRKNPRFITATGQNADIEAARHSAEKALVSQIQVAIGVTSNYTSTALEDNTELKLTTEFITRHQSYAGILFKGLGYIENFDKNQWSVFAYINRDSLAASYAYQKSKIIGLTSSGLAAINQGSLGEGLKYLHQAWLLSHFYPDTINFSALKSDLPSNPQVATAALINSCLARLEVTALDCYKDDPIIMAPLKFSLDGKPVKDLTISYYSGGGMEFARVLNGKADLPYNYQPFAPEQRLLVTIEFVFDSELKADQELAGLYEMFGSGDFSNIKTVTLRFPWILPEPAVPVNIAVMEEPRAPLAIPVIPGDAPSLSLSEPLFNLCRLSATPDFLEMLVQYSKLGNLAYGRQSDFGDGRDCYVAIFDDNQVIVFLLYDGVQYRTLDDRASYTDLSTEFKGRRQVWIKETRK